MENVCCCLCGSEGEAYLESVRNSMAMEMGLFDLVVCQNCGLVWVNPRPKPERMIEFYPETYWDKVDVVSSSRGLGPRLQRWFIRIRLKQIVKIVKKFVGQNGKILDVGCGTAEITHIMNSNGFDAIGIDFSSEAAQYAREVYHVHVDTGNFLNFSYEKKSFDCITLFGVLEHMPEPLRVLERCQQLLRSKGVLIVQIPNIESLQFGLFKKRWSGLNPPVHLYQFSPSSLGRMLNEVGLTPVRVYHFSLRDSPSLILRSFFPKFHPHLIRKLDATSKAGLSIRAFYLLGQLSLLPFVCVESFLRKGGMITVCSVKNG